MPKPVEGMKTAEKTTSSDIDSIPSGGRSTQGLLAGMIAPGLVVGLCLCVFADSESQGLADRLMLFLPVTLLLSLDVTLPATLILGLPTVLLFKWLSWQDWPRHALGGTVIGSAVVLVLSMGLEDFRSLGTIMMTAFGGGIGALAATAYWFAAFGRTWVGCAAILLFFINVGALGWRLL